MTLVHARTLPYCGENLVLAVPPRLRILRSLLSCLESNTASSSKRQLFGYVFQLSLTSPQVGASTRPFWTAFGLDPIPRCVAAHHYCCSTDNNLRTRSRIDI